MTPYGAAKVVNARLKEEGIDKVIPPQMMYNYTTARVAKGKKPFIALNEDSSVNEESLSTWLESYVAKQKASVTA